MADVAVFNRLDEHGQRLSAVESEQAVMKHRMHIAEQNMEKYVKESAEARATILASISTVQQSVSGLAAEEHKRIGARDATRWLVPTTLTVLSLLTAWDVFGRVLA